MLNSSIKQQLQQFLTWPVQYHAESLALGVRWRKGCLLHGPPGVGKTSLVQMAVQDSGAVMFEIKAADLSRSSLGESEAELRRTFHRACKLPPGQVAVVFVDEIDAICPQRSHASVYEARLVAQLLTLLDGTDVASASVRLIAATNLLGSVDSALRRPGRIDLEIFVPPPGLQDRLNVLTTVTRNFPLAPGVDLALIASSCRGYTVADLHSLCSSVALKALGSADGKIVTMEHFSMAMSSTAPTLLRIMYADGPQTTWEAIQGYWGVKIQLKQAVEWPNLHWSSFSRLGAEVPKGILLYGPSGCCKTSLAHGIASLCHFNFISLSANQLHSMYVGVGETILTQTFRHARLGAPTILLLDDLDTLFESRNIGVAGLRSSSLLSTMLTELDGLEVTSGVTVVATTNKPWGVDSALLRPGRFSLRIFVPTPDEQSRLAILVECTASIPCDDVLHFHGLLSMSEGWSCAEIRGVYNEAARIALQSTPPGHERPCVRERDIRAAAHAFRSSVNPSSSNAYQKWGRT